MSRKKKWNFFIRRYNGGMKDGTNLLLKIVRLLAFLLSLAVVIYAANYLIFGAQIIVVKEIALEQQETPPAAVIESEPYPIAVIPFAAAISLIVGVLVNKELLPGLVGRL